MKVYTEQEVNRFYKSFRDFCKENNFPLCNFTPYQMNGLEVELIAKEQPESSQNPAPNERNPETTISSKNPK